MVYSWVMQADIGIGIIIAVIAHLIFHVPLTLFLIVTSILCSLLPDIDMLKIMGPHRGFTHYPLIYIPIILMVYFLAGPLWTFVLGLGVLFHLIHDLSWIGSGVTFWWPFSKKRYKFFSQDKLIQQGEHWITTFYFRLNVVTVVEYSIFVLGLIILFSCFTVQL